MFVFRFFFEALAYVLNMGLSAYMMLVIVAALLSWVSPDPYNPIVRFIHRATEPVLYQIRKRLPVSGGGIDFSPFVLILAIYFLKYFLVRTLFTLAHTMAPGAGSFAY
ncbi:MAG: YggT family protein [Deltaproteobacteria bacterium]|nr:YggT family protein [Deltaproteobacteria bacterium]